VSKKLTLAVLAVLSTAALADINVGVSLSATGPAASLGIPEKNTIALLPTTIGGQKVNYIVLDDATDPTAATKNIKKLISENKVDVVVGSSTTPSSLAMMAQRLATSRECCNKFCPYEERYFIFPTSRIRSGCRP